MIDAHDVEVEIKIVGDPNGGFRIWVHVAGELAVRVYRARLVLDARGLPIGCASDDDEGGEYDE